MRAIRLSQSAGGAAPFSTSNPAPASALRLVHNAPKPRVLKPGQILVQVKASSVVRDSLTWSELYAEPAAQLGIDFSGVVNEIHEDEQEFHVGEEVFGMISADRGGAWAEYALVEAEEAWRKPSDLSWEEAAALPMSALTADQALHDHSGLRRTEGPSGSNLRLLITGASGGVGTCLVQMAADLGYDTIACSRSRTGVSEQLRRYGASEVFDYSALAESGPYDSIIDTVGGDILRQGWASVKQGGTLISVHSLSGSFVEDHRQAKDVQGEQDITALFFIVQPSRQSMQRIVDLLSRGRLKCAVAQVLPMEEAEAAYGLCSAEYNSHGRVILRM